MSALNECRVFVLVFSAHANSSDHVLRELERAASKGKPILPFRLDSAAYSESMEYFLSKLHWLDALTPPLQSHIDRLVGTLNGMLKPSGLKM